MCPICAAAASTIFAATAYYGSKLNKTVPASASKDLTFTTRIMDSFTDIMSKVPKVNSFFANYSKI